MDLSASIQKVLTGDLDAFGGVVRSYQVAVTNLVATTFPRAHRVEEIVQEVFIRTFRQLPGYETSQPFWPWLRGIVRNVVFEELRAEQRTARERRAFAEAMLLKQAEQAAVGREEKGERTPADSLSALRRCLEEQAGQGSRMVRLFYVEGLSSDRIAEKMGCGGSAVRNALMRIRRALKECVQKRLQAQPVRP